MMPESQLSVALVLVGSAFEVPQMRRLYARPDDAPIACCEGLLCWRGLLFWLRMAVSAAARGALGAWRRPGWAWPALFGRAALLILAGPAEVWVGAWRGGANLRNCLL